MKECTKIPSCVRIFDSIYRTDRVGKQRRQAWKQKVQENEMNQRGREEWNEGSKEMDRR